MKKMLKVIGIIILLVVGFIVLALINESSYYKKTTTEKEIDKKYAEMGNLKVSSKNYDANDDTIKKYVIWYPTELKDNKYPVVIWANGTGSKSDTYKAFLKHLSSWGFIVVGNDDENTRSGESLNNFIWWGNGNIIYKSNKSSIGWGDSNTITGNSNYSTIPGWFFNEINNAIYSFAVWVRAKANSNNSFVWNSDNGADFTSIKTWTFIINVPWGSSPDKWWVGINTNNPEALLDVNWKIKAKNIELDKRSPTVTSWGSCGWENPGTIIYDGVGFYGCGPSNTRKRLD